MLESPSLDEGLMFVSRASKKARRKGLVPEDGQVEQRWATAARQSIGRYEDASYGKRGSLLNDLAKEFSVKPSYLRQAMTAYKFATSGTIENVVLSTFPIAVVDELKRWSEFDLEGATNAAQAFAREDLFADEFAELALDARSKAAASQPAYRTATAFRAQVRDAAPSRMVGFELHRDSETMAETYITLRTPDGAQHGAVVVTGPHDDPSRELTRCKEALLTALGLVFSCDRVALACASRETADYARELLSQMRRAKGLAFRDASFDERLEIWDFGSAEDKGAHAKPVTTDAGRRGARSR